MHYLKQMDQIADRAPRLILWTAFAAVFSIAAALVFAGWMRFGPEIVLTFTENGLSLCL